MNVFLLAFFAFLASAGIADAGPVGGAIALIAQWGAQNALNSFILTTALSTGMSMISQALMKRNQPRNNGGITIERATMGDTTSGNIMLGHYATAGNHVAPPYTQGWAGDTPNAFLTQILDVSDYPADGFPLGVWINEDWVPLNPTPTPVGSLYPGRLEPPAGTKYHGYFWIKFYDGRQTAADPILLQTGASGPRPWTADMIGRGVAYVVAHYKFEQKIYSGEPELLIEVRGARLYDPRRDSTVGGSGPQRWGQPNTYEHTENPVVMIYNIKRGITFADGTVWGGRVSANGLPLANWIAAMNKCDVPRPDGKPMFRAGMDVRVGPEEFQGDEPAGVIEELMAACSASIAEISGGVWHIRVGGPDLPVAFMTDDDIIITENELFEPFPSIDDTINGLQTQYPEPRERWAAKQAPTRYSSEYEAQDMGKRRIGNLSLPAVFDEFQVQYLMRSYVEDNRRFRQYGYTLPPDFAHLTPLDSIGWTSERNGFVNFKTFEITSKKENLNSLNVRMNVRERDALDYDYDPSHILPTVINPPYVEDFPVQVGVPYVFFEGHEIIDNDGKTRRAGALITWIMESVADVVAVSWEITPQGQNRLAANGSTTDVVSGRKVVELPGGLYRGRAKVEALGRPTEWGPWQNFTVPFVGLSWDDLVGEVREDFFTLRDWANGTGGFYRDILDELGIVRDEVIEGNFHSFTERERLRADIRAIEVSLGEDNAALAAALDLMVARVEETEQGLAAQADIVNQVEAKTDRGTANGLFRVSAVSAPTGVYSRLHLGVQANGATGPFLGAGVYMDASTVTGRSNFLVTADRFAIINGPNDDPNFLFVAEGNRVVIDGDLWVKSLSIGPDKIQFDGISDLFNASFAENFAEQNGQWKEIGRLNFTPFSANTKLLVTGQANLVVSPSSQGLNTRGRIRVLVNGVAVFYREIGTQGSEISDWVSIIGMRRSIAGINTVSVEIYQAAGVSLPALVSIYDTSIYVVEFKK